MAMKMRVLLIAVAVLFSSSVSFGESVVFKPTDFEPLTGLPWKWPGANMESILNAIFREPDLEIRYAVLAEYLRILPARQLGKMFDLSMVLEGTNHPDRLITIILPVWAKREPVACWKRTRELFRLVGIEDGWLDYDSWKERNRITVQDHEAIQTSPFWIEHRESLVAFCEGVDESAIPKVERVRLMKEFANLWLSVFGTWPGSGNRPVEMGRSLLEMFECPSSFLQLADYYDSIEKNSSTTAAVFTIVTRRRLELEPQSGPELVKQRTTKKWPSRPGEPEQPSLRAPIDLLIIWARVDLEGFIRWTESLDIQKDEIAAIAEGFLMSRVDSNTRDRWLTKAKSREAEGGTLQLLSEWAKWDPTNALKEAVSTNEAETISEVAEMAAYGPFGGQPFNSSHFGMRVIKDFDLSILPKEVRDGLIGEWGITIMEQWGDIAIGEAARYGLDFMLRNNYAPRKNLMKLFSGDDRFSSDSDMIDRTFCALRVWAVVRPREMKAWIGTIKEANMRKALTWLLEHPWGTGPKE